jgi:hypothetical protein
VAASRPAAAAGGVHRRPAQDAAAQQTGGLGAPIFGSWDAYGVHTFRGCCREAAVTACTCHMPAASQHHTPNAEVLSPWERLMQHAQLPSCPWCWAACYL